MKRPEEQSIAYKIIKSQKKTIILLISVIVFLTLAFCSYVAVDRYFDAQFDKVNYNQDGSGVNMINSKGGDINVANSTN